MTDRPDAATRRDPALTPPLASEAGWGELDLRAVDTIRVLAADAVEKAVREHRTATLRSYLNSRGTN